MVAQFRTGGKRGDNKLAQNPALKDVYRQFSSIKLEPARSK